MSDDLAQQLQSSLGAAYTIERELGGGGMSRVFIAEETRFHRRVVIKVLSPELAAGLSVERFEREIGLAAALQHANIVPVITAGVVDGLPWYTMPYVDGESLRTRLERSPASLSESVKVLGDMARALAYAHERGIVHRDIKPENVLLSGGAAIVTDFGIAKALCASKSRAPGATLTVAGTSLGTPAYMAPEQAAGDSVDERADIYAWGVIAYELLASTHPFAGKTTAQQLIAAHIAEAPLSLLHLKSVPGGAKPPRPLVDLVMQCLAKDPGARPRSGSDLLSRLEAASDGHPTAELQRSPRTRVFLGVVAVVLLSLVIARFTRYPVRWLSPHETAATATTRIAVLPLENAVHDTADAYFADGMSDALIQALSRIPQLTVISRRSAAVLKGRSASPEEIGRALDIASFVEGTVRREGGRLRLAVQLTNAKDGTVLWSERYDRPASAVFALQDELTRAIATELRVALVGGERGQSVGATPARTAAYDIYLLGMHQMARFTEPDLRAALATFQRAIAIDSTYAAPWAGISAVWGRLADDWVAPRDAYPRSLSAAKRALALDSSSAEAYTSLAWVSSAYAYDLRAATNAARHALALAPNDASALQIEALSLGFGQFTDSSLAIFHRARSLDPLNSLLAADEARVLLYARRDDAAITAARAALAIDPGQPYAHFFVGQALLHQGKAADALIEFERASAMRDRSMSGLAAAQSALGHHVEARRVVDTMVAESRRRYVRLEFLAWGYLAIGDRGRAIALLEQAYANRAGGMVYVPVDPRWDALKGDRRFDALVRKIRGR